MIFWKIRAHAVPALQIPPKSQHALCQALNGDGSRHPREPTYPKLSAGRTAINGISNRSSSHSCPFLLNDRHTCKAGEAIRGTMPCRAFVMGATVMILYVFSRPSFAVPAWCTAPPRDSVATSVSGSRLAFSSDGRYADEANTSQVEAQI